MRVFKSKWFARFARKEGIDDATLCAAIRRAAGGKVDADYGGGVIKQRIARLNEGKSGGYRSIILIQKGKRAFFVYGFAKNERDNIGKGDEEDFKELAKILFAVPEESLEDLKKSGKYSEIEYEK